MTILDTLKKRRTIYQLNKNMPVSDEEVIQVINDVTELTPDAFNMKSARVIVAMNDNHDALWDVIYDAFEGKVSKEKIQTFKDGYGTVLYFIDDQVVENLQEQFALYADNFPVWAQQANGMLQYGIWNALADLNVGASLQHYNPVIDKAVKEMFNVPEHYRLIAQMPFGGIVQEAESKEKEDITQRVKVFNG
jgi:predicted oxidoreductase (fatty acid repression mutant protein)